MAKLTFKLDGLKSFQDKIAQLPKHLHEKAANRATAKAADHLRHEIKKNTPLAKQGSYAATFRGNKITRNRGDLAKALIIKRIPYGELSDNFAAQHKVVFYRNAATKGIGYIAHFLENGTQPHEIELKKSQRVPIDGKFRMFPKKYTHQGTKGTQFFSKTLRANRKKMNEIMEQEIMKAIQEHFK